VSNFTQQQRFRLWQRLILSGCLLFSLLYVVATFYYPGGTYLDKSSQGFSWAQNYWCNLLNENAINGQHNPAKPIAFTAMIVLSLTVMMFWYMFPFQAGFKTPERYIMQLSGFLSMAISVFISTDLHDSIINVAGLFGLIALTGTLIGLRKLRWTYLFYMGLFIVLLLALNNLLYYLKNLMYYLPVVQKITFLSFLLWICFINLNCQSKTTTGTSFVE
jgi:hypothetical protein